MRMFILPIVLTAFLLSGLRGIADVAPTPGAIHESIMRSLPAITKTLAEYPNKVKCFSCHHQGVTGFALGIARVRGYSVDTDLKSVTTLTSADIHTDIKMYTDGDGQPGGVTRAGYALLALNEAGVRQGDETRAIANWILKRDGDQGFWRARSNRPPGEFSNFTDTFLAIRALNRYGDKSKADAIAARITKARIWLEQAPTKETEDRVFRLWGLKESGSGADVLSKASRELLDAQLSDGGWAQLPGGSSDAYATGSVLTILRETGTVSAEDPAYMRGISYLLKSQLADGTWHVTTRSHPVQPYFESGFPYGKDQFISMAATGWAVAALALGEPATR
jgi:hypothetical protein